MTKDELFEVIDYNTVTMSHNRAIKTAVEAYSSASNGGKPIVSGSLPQREVKKLINGFCELQAAGLWEAFKEENKIMLNELRMLISGNDR